MNHPEKWTFNWFYNRRGVTIDETQKKLSSMLSKDEFLQELDGRAEDERPISLLRRDAMEFGRLALSLSNENKKLRAFANDIMEAWPDGGIEGDDLQEIATRHGMLAPEIRYEPCGEWCQCNGIGGYDSDDWQRGVECYRRTALLTGGAE